MLHFCPGACHEVCLEVWQPLLSLAEVELYFWVDAGLSSAPALGGNGTRNRAHFPFYLPGRGCSPPATTLVAVHFQRAQAVLCGFPWGAVKHWQ